MSIALSSLLALAMPTTLAVEPGLEPIIGGEPVAPGAWPAVVQVEDRCTGTLVHPMVVVYAGHCGQDIAWVSVDSQLVLTAACFIHPDTGAQLGHDLAACVLDEAATTIPIPIATDELAETIAPGSSALLVGYGRTEPTGPVGVKHSVLAKVLGKDREWLIGRDNAGTCAGDSGGPALVRNNDGWWVLGVLSGGVGPCGAGYYTDLATHQAWLESITESELAAQHPPLGPEGDGCRIEPHRRSSAWRCWVSLLPLLHLRRRPRPAL